MGHLRSGTLRNPGNIMERSEVSDSGAADSGAWTILHENIWASIEPMRGQTSKESGLVQDVVTTKIIIRHKDGITNRMRFRHLSDAAPTDYDIVSVSDPSGMRVALELICVRSEDAIV